MQEKIIKIDKIDPKDFFGPNDRNIKTIKSNFPNLKIVARGDEIKVYGSSTELSDFEEKIDKLINYSLRFENIEDNLIGSFLILSSVYNAFSLFLNPRPLVVVLGL